MYTTLYETTINGGTMVRPEFFEFPLDEKIYDRTESSFLIGKAVKVIPVLEEGADKVEGLFPKGSDWISLVDK